MAALASEGTATTTAAGAEATATVAESAPAPPASAPAPLYFQHWVEKQTSTCSVCFATIEVGAPLWPHPSWSSKGPAPFIHTACAEAIARAAGNVLLPPICKHWARKGACAYEATCFFRHPKLEAPASDPAKSGGGDDEKGDVGAGGGGGLAEGGGGQRRRKKRPKVRNDSRAFVFRKFLLEHFGGAEGLRKGSGVVEVGGGKGELAYQLQNLNEVACTVVDPRPLALSRFVKTHRLGYYTEVVKHVTSPGPTPAT